MTRSSPLHCDILNKLAYFDVFQHPLHRSEIDKYCFADNVEERISELINDKIVFEKNGYLTLSPDKSNVERRLIGEKRSKSYLKKGTKKARLIAKFPFVRGVFISGSLSKGYMPEDGDVDFFIITKKNRLWVARTFLILYKKVFLLNSRKYFCVNYFIDEENLEIPHQNIFTATEVTTLLPIINEHLYSRFISHNLWIREYYPETITHEIKALNSKKSVLQKIMETSLNGSIGEKLDVYFMKITLKKWRKKFKKMNSEDFEIAMQTTRRSSKHHPSNFQKTVLNAHAEKMEELHSLHVN